MPSERILIIRGHGDDRRSPLNDARQHAKNLLSFAAIAQNEEQIFWAKTSEISVHGFTGMNEVTSRAGGRQRGGKLLTNPTCFTDPCDQSRASALGQHLHGPMKIGRHMIGETG